VPHNFTKQRRKSHKIRALIRRKKNKRIIVSSLENAEKRRMDKIRN
jgi:hypothetical protein